MPISHEGAAEKIGIEYSVIHSEKHNTTCEGLLVGIFHSSNRAAQEHETCSQGSHLKQGRK